MKKLLLASAAIAALVSGTASAADLGVRPRSEPAMTRSGCAQFGGMYVGGNIGWGYGDHRFSDRDGLGKFIDDGLPSSISATGNGFNGGVQAGYNMQRGCTVVGLEADWNWSDLRASEFSLDGDQVGAGVTDSVTVNNRMRWFGALKLRTGIVVDNMMFYATGGLAYANFRRTWTYFEDGPATTGVFNANRTRLGWTTGVGTEWQMSSNWSLKSEVLYMRFEQDRSTATGDGVIGQAATNYRLDSHDSVWVTRIGLNYRFGGGPVVARY